MALAYSHMLIRYLKIYRALLNNSFSYEAQYRGDTLIKLVTNLLWVGMLFLIIEIIFTQTSSLAGWSREAVYLMTVFWVLAEEAWLMFFGSNVPRLPETIVRGDLDFYLTKPVAPLFLVSTRIFLPRALYRFMTQAFIFGWLIYRFDFAVSTRAAVFTVISFGLAFVIAYATSLAGNTLAFWYHRIDNINELIGAFRVLGRYPLEIWPKTFKIILLTALPVVFSGYVPVAMLTGRWPWYALLYAMVFSMALLAGAIGFWRYALRQYSSASS